MINTCDTHTIPLIYSTSRILSDFELIQTETGLRSFSQTHTHTRAVMHTKLLFMQLPSMTEERLEVRKVRHISSEVLRLQ